MYDPATTDRFFNRLVDIEPVNILKESQVELLDNDEYSVRVYDANRERRLVAAIELVSPANKDRPESKQAFVSKCAALLREEVSVMIVDVVTSCAGILFADLLTASAVMNFMAQCHPQISMQAPAV